MLFRSIRVEGEVVEVLSARTYRVKLANGHRLLAFVSRRAQMKFPRLVPGNKVILEMSPYDLSEGRIVGQASCLSQPEQKI